MGETLPDDILLNKKNTLCGFSWCGSCLRYIADSPGRWCLFALWYGLLMTPLSILPGCNMIFPILMPFFLAVLYLAAQAGFGFFECVRVLYDQFRKPIFVLGAINIGLSAALMLGSILFAFFMFLIGNLLSGDGQNYIALVMFSSFGFLLFMMTGYMLLLSMVLFSPALVIFNHLDPWSAMVLSLRAVLRNMGAVTLYSVVILIPLVIGFLPLVRYGMSIEVPVFSNPVEVLPWIKSLYRDGALWFYAILGTGFAAPFIGISLYNAYKDMFVEKPAN